MALFLDLDGTLLDFAVHPDAVRVPPELRKLLLATRQRLHGALAILSGRSLQSIDALLDIPDLVASGVHGAQWRDGAGASGLLGAMPATTRERAARLLRAYPGTMLEDKHTSLALHYRGNPAAARAIEAIAADLVHALGTDHELQRGDHVIEIKPCGVDKGLALARIMRLPAFRGRQPWMLGDDQTDEHAFAEVNACDGVSVLVGNARSTLARYRLPDPAAVRDWLAKLSLPDTDDGR